MPLDTSSVGKLTVSLRQNSGKGAAIKLRQTGKVPGVCYGASPEGRIDPLPIIVDVKALRAALDPIRKQNTVIDLTIDGTDGGSRKLSALVKDYQIHPIRRDITHVDLLAIDPNKEVVASVPLEFVGKPKGTIHGGQLRFLLRSLGLRAKPADIPVKLTVDVSELDIGDVTHVAAIQLPAGVTAVTGRDLAVVTLAAPEEEKAPAAGEAAALAEGAAAAAAPAAAKDAKAAPAAKAAAPAAKAATAAKPAAKK
jgi:large subunit ribosomal protein L25